MGRARTCWTKLGRSDMRALLELFELTQSMPRVLVPPGEDAITASCVRMCVYMYVCASVRICHDNVLVVCGMRIVTCAEGIVFVKVNRIDSIHVIVVSMAFEYK